MATDEIQALLDTLAAELQFSLTLEDPSQHLLAYTDHAGPPVDDVRVAAILGRRVAPPVRDWFEQWGIRDAVEPVRTPSADELGAMARWCIPVRFRRILLGYVWILDGGQLPAARLESGVDVANQLSALLYRRRLAERADAELVRLLVLPRDVADDDLTDAYPHRGPVAVVVVGSATATDLERGPLAEARIAVRRACESFPPGAAISGEVGGAATAIVPLRRTQDPTPARRLAETALRFATRESTDVDLAVGISGAAPSATAAAAAHTEARRALRVAQAIPTFAPIAVWDDLGVFRTLAMVPSAQLDRSIIDPRVRVLLEHPALVATAEAFLDRAGDAQATAEHLRVHRATLYQRLARIRELAGLDLMRSGDDRLVAHLGLRLNLLTAHRTR